MPELPEVETIRAGLNHYLKGKTVVAVSTDTPKLFPNDRHLVNMFLINSQIEKVERRGKAMLIFLSSGYILVVHLKMTGQMVFVDEETGKDLKEPMPSRFTHIVFTFSDGSHLYYNDQRKFGWVKLMTETEVKNLKFLKEMGVEPLTPQFTFRYLKEKLERRKGTAIKTALLDQKIIAGIGNIYADESLFLSAVMPTRPVASLSDTEIRKIVKNIKSVLQTSIDLGGSSRKDYINAIGQKGDYLDNAFVYGRTGQGCRKCDRPIEKIKCNGRGTHFCRNCQK